MSESNPTILFAGGGTGGHLFPSLAIAQRLPESVAGDPAVALRSHFLCSDRQIDASILQKAGVQFTPLPVKPLPRGPLAAIRFVLSYWKSRSIAKQLIRTMNAKAIVAMGGFVSGPVVSAARSLGVPVMMVNLDAVPGKANRWLAGKCDHLFTVYPTDQLGTRRVDLVPMPLRQSCLASGDRASCRAAMGLDPERPVLLVTGASQGAESLNQMMIELLSRVPVQAMLARWQLLHLAGPGRDGDVRKAYEEAGLRHVVLDFCDTMGQAWGAADLAISRAGAGSVAEAVANAVPTVFLPYPHHKDQHQRLNAAPIVEACGAVLFDDHVDPVENADRLQMPIMQIMDNPDRLERMRANLRRIHPGDGATRLAREALDLAGLEGEVPDAPSPATDESAEPVAVEQGSGG